MIFVLSFNMQHCTTLKFNGRHQYSNQMYVCFVVTLTFLYNFDS